MKVKEVKIKRILNSKRQESIEINVNGFSGSVGSGSSKGKCEFKEFRYKNLNKLSLEASRFLKNNLINFKFNSLKDLEEVEKIVNKNKFGGNILVALEIALLKALTEDKIYSLFNFNGKMPRLLGNCIGGGKHFKGESCDFQEFLLIPRVSKIELGSYANSYIYDIIKKKLKIKSVTYENAFVLNKSAEEILEFLSILCEGLSDEFGFYVDLGVDMAASNFYRNKLYHYNSLSTAEIRARLNKEEQLKYIQNLVNDFNLKYVEDPFNENDFKSFGKLKNTLVCGDDLICTNLERLKKAKKYINCVIIKPNQIGSLVETFNVIKFAKKNKIKCVISHRSGETSDYFISDLAVGLNLDFIKCGIKGKEREIKIKRLLDIEKKLL